MVDLTSKYRYYRFGSHDSQDVDVAYVFDHKPTMAECKAFCQNPLENRNIVVLSDGVVAECFKGLPDEMNNALYETLRFHPQKWPNPIIRRVKRNVPLKIVRATRIILSLLSRTLYRPKIKEALRSYNQFTRQEVLAQLDFAQVKLEPDTLKSIAFQLGQALGLLYGRELYTKSDIVRFIEDVLADSQVKIEPFLYRRTETQDLTNLNCLRNKVVQELSEVYIRTFGTLNLFCYMNSAKVKHWNSYTLQSRGIIIDLKEEHCVVFPYEKFFKLNERAGWNLDDLPLDEPVEIVEKVDGSFVSAYFWEDKLCFACKGNFEVEQSLQATRISKRYLLENLELDKFHYVFEVVYPDNRFPKGFASVDYAKEALFLTGIRHRLTGDLLPYSDVIEIGKKMGIPSPRVFGGTFKEVLLESQTDSWQNAEGWVASFNGKLVKIKFVAFERINDILNAIKHENSRVLRMILKMTPEKWREYIAVLPSEFTPFVKAEEIFYKAKRAELLEGMTRIIEEHLTKGDLQSLVRYVKGNLDPIYHRVLLRFVRGFEDDRKIRIIMLKKLFVRGKKQLEPDWAFFDTKK